MPFLATTPIRRSERRYSELCCSRCCLPLPFPYQRTAVNRRTDTPTCLARSSALLAAAVWGSAALAVPGVLSGCATLNPVALGLDSPHVQTLDDIKPEKPPSRWKQAFGGRTKHDDNPYVRPTVPEEAKVAYADAQTQYDSGKYEAAEKASKTLAKQYKDTVLEEDALFLQAEAEFAQKRYSKAADTYLELFERFPSTRYMDRATAHMFELSRYWLQFPEIVKGSEVQTVNFDKPSDTPLPAAKPQQFDLTRTVPVLPNVSDRTRPWFDTEGRALETLKAIWLHDPTGPLADDALMMTASYYLRRGNFQEADHYYQILREEYPKSPHLEDAFLLGSHVKLMSYQGAAYDGTNLEQAGDLKESTLKLFPNSGERDRLLEEQRKIAEARAARQWGLVQFYQKKGKDRAVAVTCHTLVDEYPDSKQAAQARRLYNALSAEAKAHLPPLAAEPQRVAPPNLEPVPYPQAGAPGRVSL